MGSETPIHIFRMFFVRPKRIDDLHGFRNSKHIPEEETAGKPVPLTVASIVVSTEEDKTYTNTWPPISRPLHWHVQPVC